MSERAGKRHFNLTLASLADQAAVSLGNFLTQIILARSFSSREYGIFALIFGSMILLNVCHWALIVYPLSIGGAATGLAELRKLASLSLGLTILLGIPLCGIAAAVALLLRRLDLWPWVALALVCWQAQEVLRRALMAHLAHFRSLWGDSISYLGQAAFIGGLAILGRLTLPRVFLVIAVSSALAAVLQALQVRPVGVTFAEVVATASPNWRIGKWALIGHFTDTATIQALPWTLALAFGTPQTAAFQALANVIGISHPVMYGVGNLIVPASAAAHKKSGAREAWHMTRRYIALGACILLPYYVILIGWPHRIIAFLYNHRSVYVSFAETLPILSLGYVAAYLFSGLGAFFNGMKRSELIFYCELFGISGLLLLGLPLTLAYRVEGACWGFLAILVFRLMAGSVFLRRLLEEDRRMQWIQAPLPASERVRVAVSESSGVEKSPVSELRIKAADQ